MCEDALTKSQAIYWGGRIFLAVNIWVFLVSQKEMRHLASQDMGLPYLSEERFKNRSVDEGNVRDTKSTERKYRYVKVTRQRGNVKVGKKQKKNFICPPAYISGAQVHF